MKHQAPQLPLSLPADKTPAPFSLEPEPARISPPPGAQAELDLPKPPPAQDLQQWLSRLSPAARRKALRHRPGPSRGLDPITGCPF